jgi:hypothetical protein
LPVRFFSTFERTIPDGASIPVRLAQVNLDLWGFPTSRPALDPANHNFVYQRFQRGIMHYDHGTGVTRGLLLAYYFKGIISGIELPPDLAEQARSSRFFGQYCPGAPNWLCRPDDLPATDLTYAFEPQ